MKIISAKSMRIIDEQTIVGKYSSGLELMERAGCAAAEEIEEYLQSLHPRHKKRLIIICGKGNNGGDGFVIARQLQQTTNVKTFCSHSLEQLQGDALTMAQKISNDITLEHTDRLKDTLRRGDIIVDCIFGTGLTREIIEPYRTIIENINQSQLPVIAIDLPSGLHGTSGITLGIVVRADLTITVGLAKSGLFELDGPAQCGLLRCVDIGFPDAIIEQATSLGEAFFRDDAAKFFKRRKNDLHKYQCGRVLVIGGSSHYDGAPLLAAQASLRCGSGLVTLARPLASWSDTHCSPAALIQLPLHSEKKIFEEAHLSHIVSNAEKSDSIVIGPGMCGDPLETKIVQAILSCNTTTVIDAGALNYIAELRYSVTNHSKLILTPHCGELRRLAESLKITADDDLSLAKKICRTLQVTIILKGQHSRTISPEGKVIINSSGSSALATAGSGDCLSGMIASLCSKNQDIQTASASAVFLHGFCSEYTTTGTHSFIADDIIKQISRCIKHLTPYA